MIRKRTAIKNHIRDQAYTLGFDFMYYRKKNLDLIREASPLLRILVSDLRNLDQQIFDVYTKISNSIQNNEYAKIIDTIPGIGKFDALSIAAEINNIVGFRGYDNTF